MSDAADDSRLVEEALAGHSNARRRLADRLLDAIQREVALSLLRYSQGNRRDARQEVRDFAQEVLVSLFERDGQELRRWDPQRGRSLDSFVRLVARRRVARILGQRRGNPWSDQPIDPGDLDEGTDDASLLRRLEERNELGVLLGALYAQLGTRDMELFELLFVEQREPEEVGEKMNMSRGAVNAWSYRMRRLARTVATQIEGEKAASSSSPSPAKGMVSDGR